LFSELNEFVCNGFMKQFEIESEVWDNFIKVLYQDLLIIITCSNNQIIIYYLCSLFANNQLHINGGLIPFEIVILMKEV